MPLNTNKETFAECILTSLSVDNILLLRYVNCYTNFWGLTLTVKMVTSCLKLTIPVLFAFMLRPMPSFACTSLYSRDLTLVVVFLRSAWSSIYCVSVIVSVVYCLLLMLFIFMEPFPVVRSTYISRKISYTCKNIDITIVNKN